MEKRIENYLIEVERDELPMNPRTWDNLGTMVCFHNRYNLGDDTDYRSSDYDTWDELKQGIIENEGEVFILPLYLYDHSGITISTSPFSCIWDSGQIGFIFISKHKVKKECIDESKVVEYLKGEVETYDKYLTGEVYQYTISKVGTCDLGHEHSEEIENCGGYFDEDECMSEAEKIVMYRIQKKKKEVVS